MFNFHRLSFNRIVPFFAATCLIPVLTSCTGVSDYTPLLNSEPGAGETINERTPVSYTHLTLPTILRV